MIRRFFDRLKRRYEGRAVILLYHQVSERKADPWQLAVHPERFELQLQSLKNQFNVISMAELVHGLRRRRLPKNTVAITFDDGFADNYAYAAPLLEWHRLPATFHLTTSMIGVRRHYWWDALQSLLLQTPHLPWALDTMISDSSFRYVFRKEQIINSKHRHQINSWSYGMRIPNERIDLYLKLWERIKPLDVKERERVLECLREWAGVDYIRCNEAMPMRGYQVVKLGANALFRIGAHTVNHVMLGAFEERDQRFEIQESKQQVESMLQQPVGGFAYPYGNYNRVSKSLVEELGFDYAVSTEAGAVGHGADPFALPRMQVNNWTPEQLRFNIQQVMNK